MVCQRNNCQRTAFITCKSPSLTSLPPSLPVFVSTPRSEREALPRFPQPGSLEYDVAMRWKGFFDQEKAERAELEDKIKGMKSSIQKDMDTIKEQHQTLMLRQGLVSGGACYFPSTCTDMTTLTLTEIARHQLEQRRLAERLREQEERLKGLNSAQTAAGIMPMFPQMPPPLFPPMVQSDTSRLEVS